MEDPITMLVKELIKPDPMTLRTSDTLERLVEVLKDAPQDVFPVLDDRDRVVGTVGELDLLRTLSPIERTFPFGSRKLVREGLARDVEDLMTPRPATARADEAVADALRRMEALRLPQLVVVDDQYRLLGLLRGRDIYCALWNRKS